MNELTTMQTVASIGNSIASMVATATRFRSVRKQDAVLVSEQIRLLRQEVRAIGVSNLTRTSITELEKTVDLIKSKHADGATLDMYMSLLQMQFNLLEQNLKNYQC